MERRDYLRKSLGLTQDEISQIVGVSRSHWSMYEIGRRELPVGSMQVLSKLLEGLKSAEKLKKAANENNDAMQRIVRRLLDENIFLQESFIRKIMATENKLAERERRGSIATYLQSGDFKPRHPAVIQIARSKNKSSLDDSKISDELLTQKLKFELLKEEEKILRTKLQAAK